MNWVQLGGSIVAILVLAGIAVALKLGGIAPMADEAAAAALAESELSGFLADEAWLSLGRDKAVVLGRDGSIALIRPHGAHYVARRLIAPVGRVVGRQQYGSAIEIDSGERVWGKTVIELGDRAAAARLDTYLQGAQQQDVPLGARADIGVSNPP